MIKIISIPCGVRAQYHVWVEPRGSQETYPRRKQSSISLNQPFRGSVPGNRTHEDLPEYYVAERVQCVNHLSSDKCGTHQNEQWFKNFPTPDEKDYKKDSPDIQYETETFEHPALAPLKEEEVKPEIIRNIFGKRLRDSP